MSAPDQPRSDPRTGRSAGRLAAAAFVVSILAGLSLAGAYLADANNQVQGLLLFLCLGGIGVGLVLWAKRYLPRGPEWEPRGRLGSTDEELEAFSEDFSVGSDELERRGLLTRLLLGAGAALGLGLIFPVFSLGPDPNTAFRTSPWKKGRRVVDEAGNPITRDGQPQLNGVITVFPEGHLDKEFAQTLLIRFSDAAGFQPRTGREDWTPENLVAYSKVCTHAGCPVGLYEEESGLLLCPCHQSTFDVMDGARPVFGPAAVSLPQLPLRFNDDDELVADGDFSDPPGPGFWNQDRIWEGDDDGEAAR